MLIYIALIFNHAIYNSFRKNNHYLIILRNKVYYLIGKKNKLCVFTNIYLIF